MSRSRAHGGAWSVEKVSTHRAIGGRRRAVGGTRGAGTAEGASSGASDAYRSAK
jgi:hypothetical protein